MRHYEAVAPDITFSWDDSDDREDPSPHYCPHGDTECTGLHPCEGCEADQ